MGDRIKKWIIDRLEEGYSPQEVRDVLEDSEFDQEEVDKILMNFYEIKNKDKSLEVSRLFLIGIIVTSVIFLGFWTYPSYKLDKKAFNLTYSVNLFRDSITSDLTESLNSDWRNKIYYIGTNSTNKSISLKKTIQMPPIIRGQGLKKFSKIYINKSEKKFERLIKQGYINHAINISKSNTTNDKISAIGGAKQKIKEKLSGHKERIASYKFHTLPKFKENIEWIARSVKKRCSKGSDCDSLEKIKENLKEVFKTENKRINFLSESLGHNLDRSEFGRKKGSKINLNIIEVNCNESSINIRVSNKGKLGFDPSYNELKVLNLDKSLNSELSVPKLKENVGYKESNSKGKITFNPTNETIEGNYAAIYKIHLKSEEIIQLPLKLNCKSVRRGTNQDQNDQKQNAPPVPP